MKLASLAASLALLPVPVGVALARITEDALDLQLRELQLAVADEVTAAVEHELTSAHDGLSTLVGMLVDDTRSDEQTIADALRLVEGHASLDHVAIYDLEGHLIDRISEAAARDVRTPSRLDAALRNVADRGAALDTAEAGRVLFVVPIQPAGHRAATGYAAAPVALTGLRQRVARIAAHRFGELRDSIAVVDATGNVLARSGGEAGSRWDDHPLVSELRGPRFRVAFARQRVYRAAGEERIGTLVSVPSRRWGVIVQVPTRTAFAPLHRMRTIMVVTVLVVTSVALLAGLLVARSITKPIRALVAFAGKLGRRELGDAVHIETSDELRVLGDAMSRASEDLAESDERLRREEAVRADLGRYLSKEIVERVIARKQDMALGGARREITVLFADVVAFTPLTEQRPPEEVVALLNELFTILTEIVFRHAGTVDKFVGDSVMAIFGAPEPSEDHAVRALATAEDMLAWLETGNARWRDHYGTEIRLAIGVHTGEAVVGNVGSETRMAYTAIGDVVNVAARLEAIARPQQILCTAAVREAAGDAFEYVDLGERDLAGRKGAVHLFEVRG